MRSLEEAAGLGDAVVEVLLGGPPVVLALDALVDEVRLLAQLLREQLEHPLRRARSTLGLASGVASRRMRMREPKCSSILRVTRL
jgi:hypothetical protein